MIFVRYVALETPPLMANAILNFHFDFPHPSLSCKHTHKNSDHVDCIISFCRTGTTNWTSLKPPVPGAEMTELLLVVVVSVHTLAPGVHGTS